MLYSILFLEQHSWKIEYPLENMAVIFFKCSIRLAANVLKTEREFLILPFSFKITGLKSKRCQERIIKYQEIIKKSRTKLNSPLMLYLWQGLLFFLTIS